jgi:Domain of unknown function (DUF5916)
MGSKKLLAWWFSVASFFFLTGPILAQEEEEAEGARPTLRVGALADEYKFNSTITDGAAAWAIADSINNLTTIEPEEGGTPAGRTIVKVLANTHEIFVRVRCFDNEPGGIVSFSKARDSDLEQEDHVLIVLDTFLDGRSGYVFAVNPSGARFDGLPIEQGESINSDWDTIWEATTSRDAAGWTAEFRIPIKSLGFKKDLTEWGFNVQRRVQRLQETSRWSSAKRDFEIYQTSRAGLLTNLPKFDLGVGLSLRPSLVGRARKPGPGAKTDSDGDLSLDVTQKIGSNLLSALTINTDFAETEVDVRQINLTRFPLFFPEKRTFFLEGADIFDFALGLDEDTMLPFFSRRIGLYGRTEDEQSPIPINAGGKINGRVGNTNLGAMVVNTNNVDSLGVPQTTVGTVRIKQNVLEESSLGMLATFGDPLGRSKSWMAGMDFVYHTSNFIGDKNFLFSVWGLLNNREDLHGDKSAYGLEMDYPNDLFDVDFISMRLGNGFDPSLGFVPRNNLHLWSSTGDYLPRPGWALVRQMDYGYSFKFVNDHDNSAWQSYEALLKPLDWLLESGDRLSTGVQWEGDRPPEEFELASEVNIQAGSYEWRRYFVEGITAEKRRIGAQARWEFGSYYNGDLNTIQASLALKPSSLLTVEFTGERNTGKAKVLEALEEESEELVETDFTEEVYGVRLLLNFSPNLQISSLTQYDTQSRELGSNNKLRWTFNPLGDIFIVYNHNLIRRIGDNRWQFVSNELPVKIQYAWRF